MASKPMTKGERIALWIVNTGQPDDLAQLTLGDIRRRLGYIERLPVWEIARRIDRAELRPPKSKPRAAKRGPGGYIGQALRDTKPRAARVGKKKRSRK